MKEILKMTIGIGILIILFPILSFAQKVIPAWQKSTYKVFLNNRANFVLKDSTALYVYHIKVEIVRLKDGKAKVARVSSNDSLMVHQIFQSYQDLYSIDYTPLLGKRKKINLVIPILVECNKPSFEGKNTSGNETPSVHINDAIKTFNNSLSFIHQKDKNWIEDVVLLEPCIITLPGIPGKTPVLQKIKNKIE